MRRMDDQRTVRPSRARRGPAAEAAGPAPPAPGRPAAANSFVFPARARRLGSVAAAGLAVAAVGWSATLGDTDRDFLLAHAVAALPYLVAGALLTGLVLRACPPEYTSFWRPWRWALAVGSAAALAAVGGAVLDWRALAALDAVLLVLSAPLWGVATLRMLDAQAGSRDASVDALDGITALVVLGAPGLLLLAKPISDSVHIVFAVPFALSVLLTPAALYLSFVNLTRIPRGQRVTQGIGAAAAAAFSVNATLQLARLLAHIDLPLPVFVAVHVTQMALLMALPLWAHRRPTGRLARLAPEEQIRVANPMPYVSAVVLPLLGVLVLVTRAQRPWGVALFCLVLLVTVVLNAVRYTLMSRETRRLAAELAHMAEERRRLLANMVRALEDDRHRTVTELHTQAVGSLASLASIIQTAYVTLPGDSGQAVRDTIAQLQGDLTERAEELRQLMVAMRSATAGAEGPGDAVAPPGDESTLGTALLAYASELYRERSTRTVSVHVDPGLELDRSTTTIVYRIAHEALLNAARHARAHTVAVAVTAQDDGGVLVEVHDDGTGFVPGRVTEGSGLATMQLFASLGRGELTIRSAPGRGTLVRSHLHLRADGAVPGPGAPGGGCDRHDGTAPPPAPGPTHLRLVPPA